jgi:hypothetical protein
LFSQHIGNSAGDNGLVIDDVEDRLLVTIIAAGVVVAAAVEAGGVGLPLCSSIA